MVLMTDHTVLDNFLWLQINWSYCETAVTHWEVTEYLDQMCPKSSLNCSMQLSLKICHKNKHLKLCQKVIKKTWIKWWE